MTTTISKSLQAIYLVILPKMLLKPNLECNYLCLILLSHNFFKTDCSCLGLSFQVIPIIQVLSVPYLTHLEVSIGIPSGATHHGTMVAQLHSFPRMEIM